MTTETISFEWSKLASVRSTWWSIAATVVVAALGAALLGLSAAASAESGVVGAQSAPQIATTGLMLAQLGLLTVATLTITGEYGTGSLLVTLQAVPRRSRVLAAKAVVVTALGALLGLVTSAVATTGAEIAMGRYGVFAWTDAVLTALGVAAYFAFLAVFALGIGTLLRSTAGTITTLLLLLLVGPQVLAVVRVTWLQHVVDYLPTTAARVAMSRVEDPYPVSTGILVLVAWAAAALGGGLIALVRRDV